MNFRFLFVIFLASLISDSGFAKEPKLKDSRLVPKNLEIQAYKRAPETWDQVNNKLIYKLNSRMLPPTSRERTASVSPDMAQKLVDSYFLHPVASPHVLEKYEQVETQIGYCFGRAAYMHLLLLKLGVDKNSIRKAWIIGNINDGQVTWGFHVATMVRANNGEWLVLDTDTGAKNLQEWTRYWKNLNEKNNFRLLVTAPEKFTSELGPYSRNQLGLDLARAEDWYRGYFSDLMMWFKSKPDLADLGLPQRLAPRLCRKLF